MKYKLLLTGKNESVIDDFFTQMSDNFEVVTTSMRFTDIMSHVSFFRPDAFVYCIYNESRDDLTQMANLKFRLSHSNIPFIIIGLKEGCDEFERIGARTANLVLHRPLSVAVIQDKIIALVKDRRFMNAIDAIGEKNDVREQPAGAASPAAAKPAPPAASAVKKSAVPEQRKHILVVDDNAMMLKMLKEHLHDTYDVATAASGKVALKFLERKTTDLILLDYEMPEENGPDVLAKLRASEHTRNIPVIFLTGVTDSKKIVEAISLKPQNYLLKPIEKEKLLDTIAKTLG